MKWKRIAALALSAALVGSVGAAGAEGVASDQELMNVTAQVKATLGLDTEVFDDFSGWSDEDALLGKRWHLEWSGDGVGLSITADKDGKIYSYNRSQTTSEEPYYRGNGGRMDIPSLPEDKSADALKAAQDFLDKVLTENVEAVKLEDDSTPSLYRNSYRYYGDVQLNGLDAPITCSVTVEPENLEVTRFWRSDEYSRYLSDIPSAEAKTTEAQARRSLKSTLDMKAQYVLDEDGKTAHVLYLPQYGDSYFVDGKTGELVNLTELRQLLARGASGGASSKLLNTSAAADMAAPEEASRAEASLTQAEKDGAAKLEGALSKEELDTIIQNAWPELGLSKYTLASASYTLREKDKPAPAETEGEEAAETEEVKKEYDITCRLTYGRQVGSVTHNKTVVVDAKTGELQSMSSRHIQGDWENEVKPTYSLSMKQAQDKAEKFLTSFAGDDYALLAQSDAVDAKDTESWEYSFTYTHQAYGYFYYSNQYTVSVDAADGSIASIYKCFDNTVELVDPGHVVTKNAALETYGNALAVHYGYAEVPVSISLAPSEIRPLLRENGIEYVIALKPVYTLTQPEEKSIQGVNATTGEVVYYPETKEETQKMTYDDVTGTWVEEAANALAHYSVGFMGGSLQPTRELTQLDMVALLCSVDGFRYDPADTSKDTLDWLYNHAYSLGLVTPETRDEDKTITRHQLVKTILDSVGYGKIAAMENIFRCDFSDADTISEMGYAALAQGLGLVRGGSDNAYAGERIITRAEAVAMLYQYMK